MSSPTASEPSTSAVATASATSARTSTPTARPLAPTVTPTPQPATQLIFDCATATVIDRVQKSYSLNVCVHTAPARPFYYANVAISWCGKPPSAATVTSSIHLDYAGKRTVQGISVIVSCDPPLSIVLTAQSLTTDAAPGTYPLQGSAVIRVAS
jgi:hypothetical protein